MLNTKVEIATEKLVIVIKRVPVKNLDGYPSSFLKMKWPELWCHSPNLKYWSYNDMTSYRPLSYLDTPCLITPWFRLVLGSKSSSMFTMESRLSRFKSHPRIFSISLFHFHFSFKLCLIVLRVFMVSLVIRHKFQLRFTPKIWHTPGVLESCDFHCIPTLLNWEILELRHRNSCIWDSVLRHHNSSLVLLKNRND